MPKGVAQQAGNNSGVAQGMAGNLSGNASSLYGSLAPTLATEAAHPGGYNPTQLASMNTAAQQSGGGSTAAAVGQGALMAARTKNAGTAQNAIAAGVHGAGENLSQAALSTATGNANLQQKQQQAGIQGEQNLYGTDLGASQNALGISNSALGVQEQADENNPWMKLATAGVQGAAEGLCPAEGSLYLMADGSEKKVEELRAGDFIMGVDDEPQEIEEIQSGVTHVIRVTTENGFQAVNSKTHAYALPRGGFVVAAKSLGKTILTKDGASKVTSVEPDGSATVFNVITDGSHTYRADGIWSVGVGDAERLVNMETWDRAGRAL